MPSSRQQAAVRVQEGSLAPSSAGPLRLRRATTARARLDCLVRHVRAREVNRRSAVSRYSRRPGTAASSSAATPQPGAPSRSPVGADLSGVLPAGADLREGDLRGALVCKEELRDVDWLRSGRTKARMGPPSSA
ncbi:hypothetical protein GCM10023220_60160 [Streptomyces ziwulingensis]|uniref:Pentapeptide repeat-containing protein n=1 Tax=Streptomyces ziwulingensis TaxID=1045501 RepID=A0ABP9CUI6_9ACTN